MIDGSPKSLAVLHLLFSITETSGSYNQHCLPMANRRDITICTIFKTKMTVPKEITLFDGDDTVLGFFRVLKRALAAKEYDIIIAHSPHVGFLFAVANMLMLGKYLRFTVYDAQNSYQNYKLRNKLFMRPTFACFRKIVYCSDACFRSYPAPYKWLVGDRYTIIPNSVNLDRIDRVIECQPHRSDRAGFTVASVGRLIDMKNPLTLLRAFERSRDPSSRLTYIGEGYLRDALKSEIQTRGLGEQVTLTGLIPRDRVFEYLSQADLVVSASHGEGLPVAVIEAMACRCPVILSDIPPHREIVAGVDFIPLIEPDDTAGFAREIDRFRQMSCSERIAIGEKCRVLVDERYSLTAMHQRFSEVYAQLHGLPVKNVGRSLFAP